MNWRNCLVGLLFICPLAAGQELVQKLSLLGAITDDALSPSGYQLKSTDRQSLRLMLEHIDQQQAVIMHSVIERINWNGSLEPPLAVADLFRVDDLSLDLQSVLPSEQQDLSRVQLDHFYYQRSFDKAQLTVGRQPLDWGNGRLWQGLNVFGSFAPIALDTEFKPGIDGVLVEYFVSLESSVSVMVTLNNTDLIDQKLSAVAMMTSLVGDRSQVTWLAGQVAGKDMLGLGFESELGGMGWRVEGRIEQHVDNRRTQHWLAGIDYQFENGIMAIVEWRHQNRRANDVIDQLLNPYLSQDMVGILLSKDLSPLLQGSYVGLYSPSQSGDLGYSSLHQFNLNYSLSDESLLLFSMHFSSGDAINEYSLPASEFASQGKGLALNYRLYF